MFKPNVIDTVKVLIFGRYFSCTFGGKNKTSPKISDRAVGNESAYRTGASKFDPGPVPCFHEDVK